MPEAATAIRPLAGYFDAGPDVPAARIEGAEAIRDALAAGHPIWLDVENPGPSDLDQAREIFGFHPLALEDVLHAVQRPKVEEYENYVFIVAFEVKHDGQSWHPLEIDLFFGKGYVVTFHEDRSDVIDRLAERCREGKIAFEQGAERMLYAILDGLVDRSFPLLEEFDSRIESIEHGLLDGARREILSDIFAVRKELLAFRRLLPGHREILGHLAMRDHPHIAASFQAYFRDVYDHVLRIGDMADSYRELLDTAVETYLSQTAERTNQVMKILAIIATMGLPLSVMTSFFGMNFEHLPGIHSRYGVLIVMGTMLAVEGSLLGFFRKRGWL